MSTRNAGLKPIASPARSVQAAEALRAAIYSGRLQPGDAVREMQLARDLQVSQTTIREALIQLEHAGLIVRTANRSTKVTELSPQDIRERARLRLVLEQIAAGDAAVRATEEDLSTLDRFLETLGGAVSANAYYDAGQADLEFHRAIWKASGDATLYRVLDDLTVPLFAFVSMQHSRSLNNLSTLSLRHEPIATAIRSGRAEAAREAMREHIEGSYGIYLRDEAR